MTDVAELTRQESQGVAPLPLRESTPDSRRMSVRDVATSWGVARIFAARDIKVKYKQSLLGPVWLLLQPLGMLAAITIAFSGVTNVDTRGVPYVLFGLVGITVWNFISMTISVAPTAYASNAALVKRSTAPRPAFITAMVASNLPLLGIIMSVTLVATVIGNGLPLQVLLLPVFVVWLLAFTWSLVLFIAPLAARFRDAIALVPLIVQAGIFISPVGYDVSSAPKNIQTLVALNPVTGLIEGWRWCILGMAPDVVVVLVAVAWTVVLLTTGWYVFRKMEVRLADFV